MTYQHGIEIHNTGGETADVGDLVRTIVVDSTVTARIKRSDVIDNARIQPGDVIVGLASSGQATYEVAYNGGMEVMVLHLQDMIFSKILAQKYPESYDSNLPEALVYTGQKSLTEVTNTPLDVGKLVLSPTGRMHPLSSDFKHVDRQQFMGWCIVAVVLKPKF